MRVSGLDGIYPVSDHTQKSVNSNRPSDLGIFRSFASAVSVK